MSFLGFLRSKAKKGVPLCKLPAIWFHHGICLSLSRVHRHVELWSLQWNRVGLHNPFSRFRIQVFLMLVVGFHATSFSKNVSSQAFSLVSSTSTGCIMFGRLGAAGDDRPRLRWIPHQGSYSELFSALVLASIPWQWKHQRVSWDVTEQIWTDCHFHILISSKSR